MVEDGGQKSRRCSGLPDGFGPEARQGQEATQTLGVAREKGQGVYGDGFGGRRGETDQDRPPRRVCLSSTCACYTQDRGSGRESSGGPPWHWGRSMTKTVLIVEDNELNMKLFNDLLEAHGYKTLKTSSGVDAVELTRTHRPDLILMDIQLPEVSGEDVTQWIKSDDDLRHIPIIAITAFAMKGDEERIRARGCEAYLSKPISVAKFIETVKSFIGER